MSQLEKFRALQKIRELQESHDRQVGQESREREFREECSLWLRSYVEILGIEPTWSGDGLKATLEGVELTVRPWSWHAGGYHAKDFYYALVLKKGTNTRSVEQAYFTELPGTRPDDARILKEQFAQALSELES